MLRASTILQQKRRGTPLTQTTTVRKKDTQRPAQAEDLDLRISEQFTGDEALLKRIRTVFKSKEDKEALLTFRQGLRELHLNGNIKFQIPNLTPNEDFYLNRMVFELVFIGARPPLKPFEMLWLEPKPHSYLWNERTEAEFIGNKKLDYTAVIYLDRLKNTQEVDFAISAESAHLAQDYLRDSFNLRQDGVIVKAVLYGLDEAPEHLKVNLYSFIENPHRIFPWSVSIGDSGTTVGHQYGSRWAKKAMAQLLKWALIDKKIKMIDIPQCIRAYTTLFSLVDRSKISLPENKVVRKFIGHFTKMLHELTLFSESGTLESFELDDHLQKIGDLNTYAEALEIKGFDIERLKRFIEDVKKLQLQYKRFSYTNCGSYKEASNEIRPKKTIRTIDCFSDIGQQEICTIEDEGLKKTTLGLIKEANSIKKTYIDPIVQADKDFAEKVALEITSISSPQELLREAKKALVNGKYVASV